AAQIAPPGLGLRRAPGGGVEFGVVSARYPGFHALAVIVGHVVPAIATVLAGQRHCDEFPVPLAGLGIVGADVAVVGRTGAAAIGHADQHPALDDHDPAGGTADIGGVVDLGLPNFLAGAGIKRIE